MSSERQPIVSGNWKMNNNHFEAIQCVQKLAYLLQKEDFDAVEVTVHPPFTDLRSMQTLIDADQLRLKLGAQNCHSEDKGAFTGEVSPVFLGKLGVHYVIVGHSERRELFGETDEFVAAKVAAVLKHGMAPILCVGETLAEREAGVRLQAALVKLVEQYGGHAFQRGIALQHACQHAFGDHLDTGARTHTGVETHTIAHGFADALTQRSGHTHGHCSGGKPSRFEHQDFATRHPRLIEQGERHHGAFACTGRGLEHGAAVHRQGVT